MKKNNKKSIYGFLILLIFLSTTFSFQQIFIHFNTLNYEISPNFPLTSANEITLITPENKTYFEPMSGYYPGTFGFENDEDGTVPEGWVDSSGAGCSVEVVDDIDNHKKVLQLNDNSGNPAIIETSFPNQQTGIVEWWWYSTNVANWTNFVFYEGGTSAIHLEIADSTFRYYDTSYKTVVSSGVSNNRWYRNRVEFSVSTDLFDWYIYSDNGSLLNSVQNANFRNLVGNINRITSGTHSGQSGFQTDIDAVGFSWDSNFNTGDNIKEGLLLSYVNSTNLVWMGYSLDGSANKTIRGNTTIPLPSDGLHNIQVFGNDSSGKSYKSEIQYFSVDTLSPEIIITTPNINQYFGQSPPSFTLSITEPNLNTIWYSLDNGFTNITSLGLTGMIDQTEWDKKSDGPVTIVFYANDSFSHLSFNDIMIYKDTVDPLITVNSPLSGEEFYEMPPEFNLTVDELNLETLWYTIDGGLTTFIIMEMTGFIGSTPWNEASIGAVTIRFYARDMAGNEIYQEVVVLKRTSEVPPEIPGFNLPILFIMLGLITIISIKIKKNKIK